MKAIRVKSNNTGLTMVLDDITGGKPRRVFNVTPQRPTIIPAEYAKSMLMDPIVTEWIRTKKLVLLDEITEMENEAVDQGYLEKPIEVINEKAILNVLKGTNITKLKELLNGPNREVAIDLAGLHSAELSQAMVREIEDIIGLSLAHD